MIFPDRSLLEGRYRSWSIKIPDVGDRQWTNDVGEEELQPGWLNGEVNGFLYANSLCVSTRNCSHLQCYRIRSARLLQLKKQTV